MSPYVTMIFVQFQDQFPVVAWQWKRAAGRMAAWPNSPASKVSSDVNSWVVYFPQSQEAATQTHC